MSKKILFDAFVSYKQDPDQAQVALLVQEMERLGLRVWFDTKEISDWERITRGVQEGLRNSKAIVIWYSKHYTEWSSPGFVNG